jgi:hypothetical protein
MAQVLSAIGVTIRAHEEIELHWIPLCWGAAILLLHVQFLLAIYDLDVVAPSWTWSWLGPVLILAALLFLSGALILPSRDREFRIGLLQDFEVNGKLALVPLSLYLIAWMPLNVRIGYGWLSQGNLLDVFLVLVTAVAFFTRQPRIRGVATVVYLIAVAWSVVVVWAPGGLDWVGSTT